MTGVLPDGGPLSASAAGEIAAPVDPFDVQLALGATGSLRAFNQLGVLTAADVHVATRLAELGGEPDDAVRLAVALAVRGVRSGSVCVDLDQLRTQLAVVEPSLPWPPELEWIPAVRASPLVGVGKPLRFEHGLLYLERYRRQEEQVRQDLLIREALPPPVVDSEVLAAGLLRLFPEPESEQQRLAAKVAATGWTTVLGGGPGTGKTTTVARVLSLLLAQPDPPLRVALAAPTGKAAARLQAAVQAEARKVGVADQHDLPSMTASTLHRLLGWVPGGGSRFRHHRENRLPFDVVVVDETSMVSLTMMARLLDAVRPDARLILVGDPDQLASVEAGAVLADLVAGLTARAATRQLNQLAALSQPAAQSHPSIGKGFSAPVVPPSAHSGVVLMRKMWRFGGDIAELAAAVRDGQADVAVDVLNRGPKSVELVDFDDPGVRQDVVDAATVVRGWAILGDGKEALAELERHRLLCAHRTGPRGVVEWTRHIESWLAEVHTDPGEGEWYAGRPVLVMKNDYALGLFNGDTGAVVRDGDGGVRVVFPKDGELAGYSPGRLGEVQTVHAMTVHRSQGSQFRRVTFVLPEENSPLSTRELLYTALTRAESFVRLIGTEAELRAAIARPAARASGLQLRLAEHAD